MLLATDMGTAVSRSSLERMLDAIRLRDERPEGVPPALPARPTLRGRLPSSRFRLLPVQLKAGSVVPELQSNEPVKDKGLAYAKMMPELESYEERSGDDDGLVLKLGWGHATGNVLKKISAVEDTGNRTLQGILCIQKHFRGHLAYCRFQELKRRVTTLQSFVRGERARHRFEHLSRRWKAAVLMQKHVKLWIARKTFDDQRKKIIFLQSVIRGCLARRHFMVLKSSKMPKQDHVKINKDSCKNLQEMKENEKGHSQVHPSVLAELRRRVLQAEKSLRHKEQENVMLQQQLQQYETRCSEYEVKMKSMEETWQKQLTSLQMSLAAAKKSLVADDIASQPGRVDSSSDHLYFDSEDTTSFETQTPESTPAKQPRPSDTRLSRNSDSTGNTVSLLVNEFEQRRQVFEDDAGLLIKVKSGNPDSIKTPNDELQKLKVRYDAWRKDYKVRLKEAKVALQKFGYSAPKARRRWWALSCTKCQYSSL